MNQLENWLKPALARVAAGANRFDALALRERAMIFAAVLAAAFGFHWVAVQPLLKQAVQIEQATVEQIQAIADERQLADQEHVDRQLDLERQLAAVDDELARLGAGATRGQPLSFLLNRSLRGQPAQVVALRELMVEAIVPDEGEPQEPVADAAGQAASAAPTLYRHRYEVTLGGTPQHLLAALGALDREARPLRIERVRLRGDAAGKVELAVTLGVIGTERAWLTL